MFCRLVIRYQCVELLWSVVHVEHEVLLLLTSRLNQDSLENFFSLIRGRGGHRDNPDTVHFQSSFKQMAVKNMFVPAPTANCQDDCNQFVLEVGDFSPMTAEQKETGLFCTSASRENCEVSWSSVLADEKKLDCKILSFDEIENEAEQNALMYVTGYVCKRILDKHNCTICRSTMLRDDNVLVSENDMFCAYKSYNKSRGSFGGLKAPSKFMFDLINLCEQTFNSVFDSVKHMSGVRRQLVHAIVNDLTSDDQKPCIDSQKQAVNIFMSTRLHYKLKFLNRDSKAQDGARKRKNRKAIKIMHS